MAHGLRGRSAITGPKYEVWLVRAVDRVRARVRRRGAVMRRTPRPSTGGRA
jgi:hypothetical protein